MKPKEMRIVYLCRSGISVYAAVRIVKELRSILDSITYNTSFKQQDNSLMQPSHSTGLSSALGNQCNQNKFFHNQEDIQSDIFQVGISGTLDLQNLHQVLQ
mmetsp:Transcript_20542/g.28908  ORF Transcript_20542/g.28908 Transcript_20542/m.28908 type:complete len:101 (+) Transcript_20542:379-681(+)